LFDVLVRPVFDDLREARNLVIVPDRELVQVPFAALWNSRTQRYVVQDYLVRMVPSAAFYLSAAPAGGARNRARPAAGMALVVGNPAADTSLFQALLPLPPLPGAAREARRVAESYGRARLLMDRAAIRGAVLASLPSSPVFHFAGHAIDNIEQPELSHLALSPGADGTGSSLYAWEIGRLSLSNMQVVVLSACSTLGRRTSRTGLAGGLAYSFLRAGAPATVSTLWDVGDAESPELLVELHRRIAAGESAAEALRESQLAALRSPRPELRAPYAWAGFVYTGR
jgi:CHAT domain-containing protein